MVPDYIQIQKGDTAAFRQFFEGFYPALCFFANKILLDEDVANDIVQEAFILLWEKKKDIRSLRSAKSYLFKFVKNRSLNYLRDNQSKNIANPEHPEPSFSYRDFVIENETYRLIYDAIKTLSPQEKRVIEFTLDGMKNPEIAKQLDVSVNTIKTLKSRAFKTLRTKLKGVSFHFFMLFYTELLGF
jgi:RNA polymerase sigma-70 factor (ECF subfamily)